jgi:hypothetical protein
MNLDVNLSVDICISLGLQFIAFINYQRSKPPDLVQPYPHTEKKLWGSLDKKEQVMLRIRE